MSAVDAPLVGFGRSTGAGSNSARFDFAGLVGTGFGPTDAGPEGSAPDDFAPPGVLASTVCACGVFDAGVVDPDNIDADLRPTGARPDESDGAPSNFLSAIADGVDFGAGFASTGFDPGAVA